jgi:hypothetical protein
MEYSVKKLVTKHNIFITGLGQLGMVVDNSKYKDLTLHTEARGVYIECRGFSCLVPWGNVITADGLTERQTEQKPAKGLKNVS